jgi:hypothetical protein
VSFATITLCVASQRVFTVVYFVIDSVRKLLDTPSCNKENMSRKTRIANRLLCNELEVSSSVVTLKSKCNDTGLRTI